MLERLEELNDEFERRFGSRIGLRIGINTGEVVAGDASMGETFVSGDPVNVAARLEQTAGVGEVLLGELTYRLTRQAVRAEPVEPLALKGKEKPVAAYRLLGLADETPTRAAAAASALVGREEELARLHRELDAAVEEGSCRLVTVLGEPGMGKSRLAEEFLGSRRPGARLLRGRCLSYGEGITYWALGEIVRAAARLDKDDAAAAARAQLGALLAETEDGDAVTGLLVQAIGLESGSGATGEIAWAARRLVEAIARKEPVVVAIEDLHWAEPALLDLLEQLAAQAQGPILLLCTSRPELLEARPEWPGTILRLEPLSDREALRLIKGADLDAESQRRVLEAAAGVPLFVEELLALLVEEGLSLSDFTIPPTIDALLAERLDRLESRQRTLLEDGAVEGALFHLGALLALAAEAADGAPTTLAELERRELVRPAPPSFTDEMAYRFRHILIRDAAYRALPKKARAELHETYASWLEGKAGERATEFEEILGYHFEQAHRYRVELGLADDRLAVRAGPLPASAGRPALGRSDMAAAEGLLTRAAELLPDDDPERIERLLGLSVALRELGEFDRAARINAEAIERAEATGLEGVAGRGRLNGAFLRLYTDPAGTDELVATAKEALPIFERIGDDTGLAVNYFAARVELLADEPARAEEIARSALEALAALGETNNSAVLATLLAEALCRQERFEEAVAATETSERTAWPDDLHAQVGWRAVRAQACAGRGAPERGEELARKAIALLEDADDLDLRGDALVALGSTLSGAERQAAFDAAGAPHQAKGNVASAARARRLS